MGSLGSRFQSSTQGPEEDAVGTSTRHKHGCDCKERKKNAQCDCESEQEDHDAILDTPRWQVRKKLNSTSWSINETLFPNGKTSDIRICALGQEWNLHKVNLCQSEYFSCMFSGSWKKSNMREINLGIPDNNTDSEGDSISDTETLRFVFESLYQDDVRIEPSKVVSILATARYLQLDGLIQQCAETMKENISVETVCSYSAYASIYGVDSVMKECLEWLLNNLMTHQNADLMKKLGSEVMEQLIQSSDLFVMEEEMDVYIALKKWMFLQLNPSWDGPIEQLLADADAWLCKRRTDLKEPFLNTEEGACFCSVFKYVRLQYIINDQASWRILERDNILPPDWLTLVYENQLFTILRTKFDNDNGPHEANKEEFELSSMRSGRKYTVYGEYCWWWAGIDFGLRVTYTNRFIVFKINNLIRPCVCAVSLQPRRHLAYRIRLASFDSHGKLVYSRSTGYQLLSLDLKKDQGYVMLDSQELSFPLHVCCNFLYTSPHTDNRPDSSEAQSNPACPDGLFGHH